MGNSKAKQKLRRAWRWFPPPSRQECFHGLTASQASLCRRPARHSIDRAPSMPLREWNVTVMARCSFRFSARRTNPLKTSDSDFALAHNSWSGAEPRPACLLDLEACQLLQHCVGADRGVGAVLHRTRKADGAGAVPSQASFMHGWKARGLAGANL